MSYKQNIWYKIGLILTIVSLIDMSITFVMMGLGNDGAIIWFFAACPTLVTGCLFMQTIRHRYEQSIIRGTEPVPMFNSVRVTYSWLKNQSAKQGIFKTLYLSVLSLLTLATIILAVICGGYAYSRNGLYHAPDYVLNESIYEEYKGQWQTARKNGDLDSAKRYYAIMEKYHNENALYRKHANEYSDKLQSTAKWCGAILCIDAVLGIVYIALFKRKR